MFRGVLLPSGCLYSLFRPEREAKERYISDFFTAELIRPKSSPLGAGFFFVDKKDKHFLGFSSFNKQFILDNSEVSETQICQCHVLLVTGGTQGLH